MTINGIALLIAGIFCLISSIFCLISSIFCLISSITCYYWTDERDAWERTMRRKDGGAR